MSVFSYLYIRIHDTARRNLSRAKESLLLESTDGQRFQPTLATLCDPLISSSYSWMQMPTSAVGRYARSVRESKI